MTALEHVRHDVTVDVSSFPSSFRTVEVLRRPIEFAVEGVSEIHACLALAPGGRAFEAADGHPVFIFVGLVSPLDSAGIHLQLLARIASLLKSSAVRARLLESKSREDVLKLLTSEARRHDDERMFPRSEP